MKRIIWDFKDPPPWDDIQEALEEFKSPQIRGVDTGEDSFACIIGEKPLSQEEAQEAYDGE